MKILQMIMEWRKGCSCAGPVYDMMMGHPAGTSSPVECPECTIGLINAIERSEQVSVYSGCITPKLHEVVASLYGATARVPPAENNWLGSQVLVERDHVNRLLHEFLRLDKILRQHFPNTCPNNPEEDHRVT